MYANKNVISWDIPIFQNYGLDIENTANHLFYFACSNKIFGCYYTRI